MKSYVRGRQSGSRIHLAGASPKNIIPPPLIRVLARARLGFSLIMPTSAETTENCHARVRKKRADLSGWNIYYIARVELAIYSATDKIEDAVRRWKK